MQDQFLIERHTAGAQAIDIAAITIGDRDVIGMTQKESDAPMAERDQLLRHTRAAFTIGGEHTAFHIAALGGRDSHKRNALLFEPTDHRI